MLQERFYISWPSTLAVRQGACTQADRQADRYASRQTDTPGWIVKQIGRPAGRN